MLKLYLLNMIYGALLASVFVGYSLLRRIIVNAESRSDVKRILLAAGGVILLLAVQFVFEFFVLDPVLHELQPSTGDLIFALLCRAVIAVIGGYTAIKLGMVKKAEPEDKPPCFEDPGDGSARMRGDLPDREEESRRIGKM